MPRSPERLRFSKATTRRRDYALRGNQRALQSVGQVSAKLHQGLKHEFLDAELLVILSEQL